jgi:lipid II:glycine glycyltransferase (peptidoglycan interpeptide bridge formation enzyme)
MIEISMPFQRNVTADSDKFALRVGNGLHDDEWDRFVESCPSGFHEQTSLWSQVKASYGWKPFRVTLSDAGGIVAGAQVLVRSLRGGYKVAYVSRGPIDRSGSVRLRERMIDEICRASRKQNVSYLAIAPPYDGHALEPALSARGFRRKPETLPPGHVMTATLLMDLAGDIDALHDRLRKQARQHIRRAQRTGVSVREGGADDVETFRLLLWVLCERLGVSPTPPEKDFFENLWSAFAPRGWVRLFLAETNRQPVAALLAFAFGDTVRAWKAGWTGEFRERKPNDLLEWEAICWAKRNGFRWFEDMGIERELAERLLSGSPVGWTSVSGPSKFKLGFSGAPLVLPDTWYQFLSPLPQLLLRTGAHRLLESPRLARFLERLNA